MRWLPSLPPTLPSNHRAPPCCSTATRWWMEPPLTILATRSGRFRPYLATTGRSTSVTGFVGLAFKPTERLMGTRSSLRGQAHKQTYTRVNIHMNMTCRSLFEKERGVHFYLNKVRFSSLRSLELRVIQSWSSTRGWKRIEKKKKKKISINKTLQAVST